MILCRDGPGTLKAKFIEGPMASGVYGMVQRPPDTFEVGQHVSLLHGPFDGTIGKIVELREKDWMMVLLDMVNHQVKANLHAQTLRPV